jgi:hypothetical protein
VQVCPSGALRFLKAEDGEMKRIMESENLEVLHPEYQTGPRVYYKNLYRFDRCFIAGSVAYKKDGMEECAAGARVTLTKASEKLDETLTDSFGDFKFDKLKEDSGKYSVEVEFEGGDKKTLEVELTTSINLGTIRL